MMVTLLAVHSLCWYGRSCQTHCIVQGYSFPAQCFYNS